MWRLAEKFISFFQKIKSLSSSLLFEEIIGKRKKSWIENYIVFLLIFCRCLFLFFHMYFRHALKQAEFTAIFLYIIQQYITKFPMRIFYANIELILEHFLPWMKMFYASIGWFENDVVVGPAAGLCYTMAFKTYFLFIWEFILKFSF